MTREMVERPDWDVQESFNQLVDALDIEDAVALLQGLGVDDAKLRGAVYGWALGKAGL